MTNVFLKLLFVWALSARGSALTRAEFELKEVVNSPWLFRSVTGKCADFSVLNKLSLNGE